MNELRLAGCRNDSLLGYLKSLGVMRIVATQIDPSVRASWGDSTFMLRTSLDGEALEAFLLGDYAPTPILNPWNSGAGFDGKADAARETLRRVAATTNERWEPYRRVLEHIESQYVSTGRRAEFLVAKRKDGKASFVRAFRAGCPDEALPWLDATIVLDAEGLGFPYLFGSGGNDGRLDFSVNFAARALDVVGDHPIKHVAELLRDAIHGTATAKLSPGVAIGQFSPHHAGGANAVSGFDAESLVNPWDYVLMLEGALLFSGAVGRRLEQRKRRALFPFAFANVPGGYGSASSREQTRGELWLPVWTGHAGYHSIVDMLRKGRADLPSDGRTPSVRSAIEASDAAAAVLTLGGALGIERFERVAFVQRNGLAFTAATIGRLTPHDRNDRMISVLSRTSGEWIERLRRSTLGDAAREALRVFDDRLFAFAADPSVNPPRARQGIIAALAQLEFAVAMTADSERGPVPYLPGTILTALDDGSYEHRVAAAVASLGSSKPATRVRLDLEQVALQDRRLVFDKGKPRLLSVHPTDTLISLLEQRLHRDSKEPWLEGAIFVTVDDVAVALDWDYAAQARFQQLLCAYSLIDVANDDDAVLVRRKSDAKDDTILPAAYAIVKLVMDSEKARDARIVRLLRSGRTAEALVLAMRRARTVLVNELPEHVARCRLRDVSDVRLSPESVGWFTACLAVPIEPDAGRRHLFRSAFALPERNNQP